ncbi:glycosyltransferase family 4 protein [Candidatus Kaiserbacteria bacterium]|nr:glycosyltransferase family 4 protein [Candidatus Kaiserbacteria bacterium]
MKKILIFSLAYYPRFTSGAEAAIREITDRIEDIEFHMITLRFGREDVVYEKVSNVHVHRVGFGSLYVNKVLFPLLAALKGISLHKKHKFDALWAMMTYMLLPVALMRVFGTRVPHVLTLQDGDPYDKVFERWFIRPVVPLLNLGFRTAKVIQVISTFLGTWPKKREYTGPVELIYNGANPKDLHPEDVTKEIKVLHEKWNKKEGDIWLVNTARLVYQKAFDDVIRALPDLPENVKFLIVGSGEDREMLEDLAKELGVDERVMFTGQIDRSEVTLYRRASDIFVMPSRSEGLGNAGLSAMASRLPMIATREGGLAEYVVDGETGWVVKKDSPEDIARAIQDVLNNPEKVEKITESARKMVLEKYDWDKVAEQMRERVFAKVLD